MCEEMEGIARLGETGVCGDTVCLFRPLSAKGAKVVVFRLGLGSQSTGGLDLSFSF